MRTCERCGGASIEPVDGGPVYRVCRRCSGRGSLGWIDDFLDELAQIVRGWLGAGSTGPIVALVYAVIVVAFVVSIGSCFR